MNWKDFLSEDGENRGRVAAVAAGIVVVFILIFVLVINIVNLGHTKKVATGATTTTIAGATSASTNSSNSVATNSLVATTSTTKDPGDPEGEVIGSGQFVLRFPQSSSNLDDAQFKQATAIGTAFVTADTTGAGANAFSYYYSGGQLNNPWVKNFQLQWVYAHQTAANVIEVQAWYSGTSLVDGSSFPQAEQDLWLDMTNNDQVINPENLASYGINYDPTSCCTHIAGQ